YSKLPFATRVTSDRSVYCARKRIRVTLNNRMVKLVHLTALKRPFEFAICRFAFSHSHEPARAHVKSLNNSLSFRRARRGHATAGSGQCAEDRRPIPRESRMCRDTRGLIGDYDGLVPVNNR